MHVDWRPAGDGDPDLAWMLARLVSDPDDAVQRGSTHRPRQCAGSRAHPVVADGAGRRGAACPRRVARHANARCCTPAHRCAWDAHVRSDAGLDGRRAALRRLGDIGCRPRSPCSREGGIRLAQCHDCRRRRADVRHHLAVDAGVRGEECDARQCRLHQHERGHREGAALRRQRTRRRRAVALDRDGARADAQGGGAACRAASTSRRYRRRRC